MATTVSSQPYNVILAGSFGVGKTFIFDKLREETMRYPTKQRNSENRLDQWTHSARCGENEIKVCLWDTGEMENKGTMQMTKSYFRSAVGVILVYDKGNLESLRKVDDWVNCARKYCQWSRHLVFALWGNDKGSFGSNTNPVLSYHLEGFKSKVDGLQDLPDELCCDVTITNVADCYQKLLTVLHSKLQDMRGSYQSFTDNNDKRYLDESTEENESFCSKC